MNDESSKVIEKSAAASAPFGRGPVTECILAVCFLLSFQNAFAQPRVQVAGIVRSATTGEPLKSAVVILRPRDAGQNSSRTTSGLDGGFSFSGLPPGQYQLTVSKTGHRTLDAGGLITILPDSPATTSLAPVLLPAGAISGRVVDWDGEPVYGAEVRAYAVVGQMTGATLSLFGRAESNDLGEYRLFDLPGGKYVLQVAPPREGGLSGQYYAGAPVAYYSGAASPSQALPVEVDWGAEVARADLKIQRGQSYRIAGVVWDASAEGLCTRCVVLAVQHDSPYSVTLPQTARASADGSFVLRGLSSGEYILIVQRGGTKGEVSQTRVPLRDRSLDELRLTVGTQQPVTGQIVLENPPEGVDVTQWIPRLSAVGLPQWWPRHEGQIATGRQFTIDRVSPAQYRVELVRLPAGAYLKALRLGGRSLASPEILVPQDNPVSGLEAVVAFDGATVQGKVPTSETRARVYLAPDDRSGFQVPKTAETAPDGSFTITSIPPGSYSVYVAPASGPIPSTPGGNAIRLRLEPKQTTTIDR